MTLFLKFEIQTVNGPGVLNRPLVPLLGILGNSSVLLPSLFRVNYHHFLYFIYFCVFFFLVFVLVNSMHSMESSSVFLPGEISLFIDKEIGNFLEVVF